MKAEAIAAALAPGDWPHALREDMQQVYPPLLDWLRDHKPAGKPLCIGLCGAQGTGKSSLAAALLAVLQHQLGWRGLSLSLDDFYLGAQARQQLAEQVHPLLQTRGVPGTHEWDRLQAVLQQTREQQGELIWPQFNKAADDRCPQDQWQRQQLPMDLVLLEGWCVGLPPQEEAELLLPVNGLEQAEDGDGRWRRWVNERLHDYAQGLWSQLDGLVFLAAPSVAAIRRWREQQEQGNLRAAGVERSGLSDPQAMTRFLAHYERLTRHALEVLPSRCDVLVRLNEAHQVERLRCPPKRR